MKSAKYMYNFASGHFSTTSLFGSGILSVSSAGRLILGKSGVSNELLIYTTGGSHVTTLNVAVSRVVYDAVWTPRGNIVCAADTNVVVLSSAGEILKKTENATGRYFSVSQDGDIYISDKKNVYKSTDDGMTWTVMFSAPDGNISIQLAIKVSSKQYNDLFWTVEYKYPVPPLIKITQLLCRYTLSKTADSTVSGVTRHVITMPTRLNKKVSVKLLTFDGHSTIFALLDNNLDVFMWSITGKFNGQLQLLLDSSQHLVNCLTVDSVNRTLYVNFPSDGMVRVFTLMYESS